MKNVEILSHPSVVAYSPYLHRYSHAINFIHREMKAYKLESTFSFSVNSFNPFTGQDVYRRPEIAAFQMGRTYIGVLTGLAVSDMGKPCYLVL